jgi:simple sugar transport system permease protein
VIDNLIGKRLGAWKLERRDDYSPGRSNLYKVLAAVIAVLITGLVIEASGESSLAMGKRILQSTLGSSYGRQQLFILATPLMITGVAMQLGSRMSVLNFGLEGQLYIGAWAAAGVGLHLEGPGWLVFPLMFLAGAFAGATLVVIPTIMRIKANISEMLTTLLFNFIAIQFAFFFFTDAWRDWGGDAVVLAASKKIPFELPLLAGRLHIGIIIAVLIVLLVHFALNGTVWGYEITSIGANKNAARFAGMKVVRHTVIILLLSGAIAGISGVIELTGVAHRLSAAVSTGYGWLGINVAILAGTSTLALIPWALFLALVLNGGIVLQTQGLSVSVVLAITGLILLLAAIGETVAKYRLVTLDASDEIRADVQVDQV